MVLCSRAKQLPCIGNYIELTGIYFKID